MPHRMPYVPDVPGADAKIVRQASVEEPMQGFLITISHGSDTQRTFATQEVLKLLKQNFGLGPGFQEHRIDGCSGVGLVTMSVRSDNYNPVVLAHSLIGKFTREGAGYDSAGNPKAGDVAKLIPIERSAANLKTVDDVLELVRPLVDRSFPTGGAGVFGVHYEEHSPANSLLHDEVVKAIGELVPPGYHVNLAQAAKTIVTMQAGNMFIASVCPDWQTLRHYNIHALTTETPSTLE